MSVGISFWSLVTLASSYTPKEVSQVLPFKLSLGVTQADCPKLYLLIHPRASPILNTGVCVSKCCFRGFFLADEN